MSCLTLLKQILETSIFFVTIMIRITISPLKKLVEQAPISESFMINNNKNRHASKIVDFIMQVLHCIQTKKLSSIRPQVSLLIN